MLGFLLFLISFILVITSSYFITNLVPARRMANSCLFFILVIVSQVVLSFEVLSVIKEINPAGVLIVNTVFFILSLGIWKYKGGEIICPCEAVRFWGGKFFNVLRKDWMLGALLGLFILSALYSLFLTVMVPSNVNDILSYHLARVGFWVQHQAMSHYVTSVLRQIVFPINSEIMLLWSMVFLKRDCLAGFLEYSSYFGCLFALFAFLSYFRFSAGRILWCLLITASLPIFILESSSCQINLFMAFLLFSSFYLFTFGVREKDRYSLAFSALALGIAAGVKSTISFYLPVFGFVCLLISIRERKKEFYKPFLTYSVLFLTAFMLFSAYNYVLNFIEFGGLLGAESIVREHTSDHLSFMSSLGSYLLMFIDIHGLQCLGSIVYFPGKIVKLVSDTFNLNMTHTFDYYSLFLNPQIHENHSKFGLFGIPIIILVLYSVFFRFRPKNTRGFYLSLSGMIGIGYLITISMVRYDYWFGRFFATLGMFCSPLFLLLYHPRPKIFGEIVKTIIIVISGFYFVIIPLDNAGHPAGGIVNALYADDFDFLKFRNDLRLRKEDNFYEKSDLYYLMKYLDEIAPDNSRIAVINSRTDSVYPLFEENKTWKISSELYPDILTRINDYDYVVVFGPYQISYVLDQSKVKYDYIVRNGGIYMKNSQIPSQPIYMDESQKIISSGKPVLQLSVIDLAKIQKDFRLIKVFGAGNSYMVFKAASLHH